MPLFFYEYKYTARHKKEVVVRLSRYVYSGCNQLKAPFLSEASTENLLHIKLKQDLSKSTYLLKSCILRFNSSYFLALFLNTARWYKALNTTTSGSHLKGNGLCVL